MIFRRPSLTRQVFSAIRQAKPPRLFVVADGPRNEKEKNLCEQTREITKLIDWDCEVLRNYSNTNLGCRNRISSGLDWAFGHVEEAIILEDDCLPHPSFFNYCESLLKRYRSDNRVMVISGSNFQEGKGETPYSYYFSKYNHCWGWATWSRAWKHWTFDKSKWAEFRDAGLMKSICSETKESDYWTHIFNKLFLEGIPDSWAYAWTFSCWSQGGLTALPNVNLVSNIGFGKDATHTAVENALANRPTFNIGEIKHPPFLVRNEDADMYTYTNCFGGVQKAGMRRLYSRLLHKLASTPLT